MLHVLQEMVVVKIKAGTEISLLDIFQKRASDASFLTLKFIEIMV